MPANPIDVLIGCEGRHLFETVVDPRIRVAASVSDAPCPDLIVFPCGHDRRLERVLSVPLPEAVRRRVSDGSVGIVFDATTEGVQHKPDMSAGLHGVITALGVSPRRCVYITQDRNYEADYRAHCAAIGFDPPVAILNHDYWIWHALTQFAADGERVFEHRLEQFRSRPARRERRFVSLNRTPRPPKILFLLSLLRDGLWDAGFISFGGFGEPGRTGKARPTPEQLAQALPGFEDRVAELAPWIDNLQAYGRVLFGLDREGWKRLELSQAGLASDLLEYGKSWFSVMTETEMRPRRSRITEKVIKPLVNFHPLLVLGNPGSLQMVRSYGFETFGEMFDESYDEEDNPRRRFDMVYEQVLRLCRVEEDALRKLEAAITEKLIFNARWGLTRFAAVCRGERDIALVNDILAAVNRN